MASEISAMTHEFLAQRLDGAGTITVNRRGGIGIVAFVVAGFTVWRDEHEQVAVTTRDSERSSVCPSPWR